MTELKLSNYQVTILMEVLKEKDRTVNFVCFKISDIEHSIFTYR